MAKNAGRVVDLRKTTKVYATDKAPYHKAGAEVVCHPELAESFIKKGYATYKADKK
jgi:hypothetical protein